MQLYLTLFTVDVAPNFGQGVPGFGAAATAASKLETIVNTVKTATSFLPMAKVY